MLTIRRTFAAEMGLGKVCDNRPTLIRSLSSETYLMTFSSTSISQTIQAIASLAVFHREWPVLILTPSSARYHWENEFQHWLGRDSPVNKEQQVRLNLGGESDDEEEDDGDEPIDESNCMTLLQDHQIHVLTSSKDTILPTKDTLVVVCSYGLAPALVQNGKIRPSLFRCAIVDESHMLKNMSTKRTSTLVPILHATNRCVLLSGTPALAKPSELWPQLKILSTAGSGWWDNESDFIGKYVKRSSPVRRAELHAMLTGTVMIRRMKSSILKSLPKKMREKAVVDVSTSDLRKEFHQCMALLREGKGVLGKLARQHTAPGALEDSVAETQNDDQESSQNESREKFEERRELIKQEHQRKYKEGTARIHHTLSTISHQLNETTQEMFARLDGDLRRELGVWYRERVQELRSEQPQLQDPELTRKSVLNKMYTLTARAKIPLLVNMIQRWLNDPTKGKLCVFAHHIFVLDELISQGELSNAKGSNKRFIRIDGSTNPKERQAQIKKFQTDPSVRIAILGITAAGVAVTLTAASTVWFAELFWTPALMIQAEGKEHANIVRLNQ
jgi:SNF2 family DNA or RNA helicase